MKRLLLCLSALLLLVGCGAPTSSQVDFFAMDTLMSATLYGPKADFAATLVQQEVNRLDQLWSRTNELSDIYQLNSHAGDNQFLYFFLETAQLLTSAEEITQATDGAFNPLVAPLMDAWGFTQEERRVPTQAELDALLPLTETPLYLDRIQRSARLNLKGQKLDMGGIAKGHAAKEVMRILEMAYSPEELTGGLLALGGNITTFGEKPDGSPWTVAVKDPEQTEEFLCTFPLLGSCATSGGYERFFEQDGVTYHHILDPKTGRPADSGLLSVTVVAEASLTDPYSTALFVMGAEKSLDFWKHDPAGQALELILVTEDKHVYITDGLKEGFDFLGEEAGYTYEFVSR